MSRTFGLAVTAVMLLFTGVVVAQEYPVKPVRLIVSVPPGGPADTLARLVGPHMNMYLNQTVVIDNRGGANGIIAYDMAARAPSDGYTLVQVAAGVVINPSLYKKVPYDPLRDFAPISLGITVPNILIVHPSVAAKSVQELLGVIRAKQGAFAFASAGNGTSGHLALELFRLSSKTQFVHVPYKGGGPALAETMAGQVQALFSIALAAWRFPAPSARRLPPTCRRSPSPVSRGLKSSAGSAGWHRRARRPPSSASSIVDSGRRWICLRSNSGCTA